MARLILGLIGNCPGVGKDTAAEYLQRYGFQTFAFASKLYQEVSSAYGVTIAFLKDRRQKDVPQARMALKNCSNAEFVDLILSLYSHITPETPLSPRFILRHWGTEYRRTQNPEYWMREVYDQIDTLEPARPAVIIDPRLENEIYELRELRQGFLLKILRPEFENSVIFSDHPSEIYVRQLKPDFTATNRENDLRVLFSQIDKIVAQLRSFT